MKALADAIVLEVGFRHCNRMNALRVGFSLTQAEFIVYSIERWRASYTGTVIRHLIEQLTPGRLALPDGYNLGDRRRDNAGSDT